MPTADGIPDEVFRHIVDHTRAPFLLIDPAGTFLYASESVWRVLGWKADELVGRNVAEVLDDEGIALAAEALAEITAIDRQASGVPVVLPVRGPDGTMRDVEVAAMPLTRVEGHDGDVVPLRLRSWEAERHLDDFVVRLLERSPIDDVLRPLARSIAAQLDAVGVAVHHGFDGAAGFAGVAGSWPGAADLPIATPPPQWAAALDAGRVVEVDEQRDDIGAVTAWLVPVPGRDDVAGAVISVWRGVPGSPLLGHRRQLVRAADNVSLALQQSAEHARLEHLARNDPLTGVANRATFLDRLAEALQGDNLELAVGFCDLDGFKDVNDRHGHAVGDDLLVDVAGRIRRSLRSGDVLARIGGDEFTILWRRIPDAAAARAVANRVVAAVDGDIGISVGAVVAGPGSTAEELLARADAALYESKQAGGRRATVRTWT